jgi:hypothetical protein
MFPSSGVKYLGCLIQVALYTVTNTFEGAIFVSGAVNATQVPTYIKTLFPQLNSTNVEKGASVYAGLGNTFQTAVAIMGEGTRKL